MPRKKSQAVTKIVVQPENQQDQLIQQLISRVSDLEEKNSQLSSTISDITKLIPKNTETATTGLTRSQINLVSERHYVLGTDADGFSISESDKPLLVITKNGAMGIGLKTPKVHGVGTLHIRSNYPSEASIPTTGVNSTRGLLLESDADDHNSYAFRVVSRQNRQGLNLTGDGSIRLGEMNDDTHSKMSVYQAKNDKNVLKLTAASKYFNASMLDMICAGMNNDLYNFVDLKNQHNPNTKTAQTVFRISGKGKVYTDSSVISNQTGYAEYFEWEDNPKKSEDRTGFSVTLTKTGKIRPATDGDKVLGVVTRTAAFVGNAAWNHWHGKYTKTEFSDRKTTKYQVLEWQNHNNTLESYINSTLPGSYPIPDNAINYESSVQGADMYSDQISPAYVPTQNYVNRENRNHVLVMITGRTIMYKGQATGDNWLKLSDVSDCLEYWILR